MNKLITILLFCCSTANAQHLKFMGLPVNCTFSDFFTELTKRDYNICHCDDSSEEESYKFNGSYFHEQPYVITLKVKNNAVEYISLCVDFEDHTEALSEYNELVNGTEEKHPEYERVCYIPEKIYGGMGESLEFKPTGNPYEILEIRYVQDKDEGKTTVTMNYYIERQHNKSDDL